MAKPTRVDPKIVLLFLILGLIPLSVGSLVLISGGRDSYRKEVTAHLSQLADNAQSSLSHYLQRIIIQVATLGIVPEVHTVVVRSNAQQLTEQQEEMAANWETLDPNSSTELRRLLNNPTSRFLREYTQLVPTFREILVTDIHGRLVASTNKTSDYLQNDERWWARAYRQGVGGQFLGDVVYDQSAGVDALEVAEPIMDPVSNLAIGVIKVVLDAQEIFGIVNAIDVGGHGQARLLRADGSVVVDRGGTTAGAGSVAYVDRLRTAIESGGRHLEIDSEEGGLVVGLPPTSFNDTFPELNWYMVVEEPYDAALGDFRDIRLHYVYVILFSLAMVGVMALIFSWLLRRPAIDVDPHLEKL